MLVHQSKTTGPRRVAFLAVGSLFSLLFAGQLAVAAAMTPAQEVVLHEVQGDGDDHDLAEIIELLSDDVTVDVHSEADNAFVTLHETHDGNLVQDGATVWVSKDDDEDPPMIGIRIGSMDGGRLVIEEVFEGSLADEAGLEAEDVIVHINGDDANWENLVEAKQDLRGGKIKLQVLRDGDMLKIKVNGKDLGEKHKGKLWRLKDRRENSTFPDGVFHLDGGDHEGHVFGLHGGDDGHTLFVSPDKLKNKLKLKGIGKGDVKVLVEKLRDSQHGKNVHVITKELIEKLGREHGEHVYKILHGADGDRDNNVFFVSPDGEEGHGNGFFYSTEDSDDDSDGEHRSFTYSLERHNSHDGEEHGELHFDSKISGHPRFEFKSSLKEAAEALERAMKEHPEHAASIKRALESLHSKKRGMTLRTEFPKGFLRQRAHGAPETRQHREEHRPHAEHGSKEHSFFGRLNREGAEGGSKRERSSEMQVELEKMRALIRERQEELQRLEKRLEELNSRSRSRGAGHSREHASLLRGQAPAPSAGLYLPLASLPEPAELLPPAALPRLAPVPARQLTLPRASQLR